LLLARFHYRHLRIVITILIIAVFAAPSFAQYKIRGTVYDSSRNYPLEAVSVLSTAGKGTSTNASGVYEIEVTEKDSIWFSYLNKPTAKFPVLKITNPLEFDISLHVNIPVLKEVRVPLRDYKRDSIQNRIDYAKIFNYQKPRIRTVAPQYGAGVGFDLDEIINMFRFRHNKSVASFQKRLLQEERDKFVEHRFSKALVRRITMLDGDSLEFFMRIYRPSYAFTQLASDYDFQLYIKRSLKRYKLGLPPDPYMKQDEEE
jgi:hypothetical protein